MRAPWTMDVDAFPRLGRRGAEFSGSRARNGAGPRLRLQHGFESGTVTVERLRWMPFARRHLCQLAEFVEWLRTLYGQEWSEGASSLAQYWRFFKVSGTTD